jgi:hypothetical protein
MHQDFYIVKDHGNIRTRIKTGFQYEEIKKIELIGKYANLLTKELNCKEKIFLDFSHSYIDNCEPDYFISFGKEHIQRKNWNEKRKEPGALTSNRIVIRQVAKTFDIATTLKLLEFSINNTVKIKSEQKPIKYIKNYNDWVLNSIDTVFINTVVKSKRTSLIERTLKTKLFRPEDQIKFLSKQTYYTQNNKFYFNYILKGKLKTLELDNVYDIKKVNKYSILVFDTDSTFYFLSNRVKNNLQKKIIENATRIYKPYKVITINYDKIAIINDQTFGNRILIYDTRTGKTIQNLDETLNKEK